jgi:hypothetical protein
MAGIFQPTLSSDIGFERPVAPAATPNPIGGVADVLSTGFDVFAKASKASGSGSKVDPKILSEFGKEVQRIEAVRAKRGDAAASLLQKRMAANYTAAGVDISDDAFSTSYETMTGRKWDYFGVDYEQRLMEDVLKSDQFRNAALAARGMYPNADAEQITQAAFATLERDAANTQVVESMKLASEAQWVSAGGSQTYINGLNTAYQVEIGRLTTALQNGVPITVKDILESEFRMGQAMAGYTQPSNVSDESFKAVRDRKQAIVDQFTNLKTLFSKETTSSALQQQLQTFLLEAGEGSLQSVTAAIGAGGRDATAVAEMYTPFFGEALKLKEQVMKNWKSNEQPNWSYDLGPVINDVARATTSGVNGAPVDKNSFSPDNFTPELKKLQKQYLDI